jgi:hypothetical protein
VSANCANIIISGNTIDARQYEGIRYYPELTDTGYVKILNNAINAVGTAGIYFNTMKTYATTVAHLQIEGNSINTTTQYGILFEPYSGSSNSSVITSLHIKNNNIVNAGSGGVVVKEEDGANIVVTYCNISGNTFINSAAGAVSLVPKNTSGLLKFFGNTVIGSGAAATITWPKYFVYGNESSHAFTLSGTAYSDNGSGVLATS